MKIRHVRDYRVARRDEYTKIPDGDQLDAIAKGFIALRDAGVSLPRETLDWLSKIEDIKARIPKSDPGPAPQAP